LFTALDTDAANNAVDHQNLTQICDALDELGKLAPGLAEVMDLKFFCGFSFVEIAVSNVPERTVQRSWEKAGHLH
jgi:hypothetical protein